MNKKNITLKVGDTVKLPKYLKFNKCYPKELIGIIVNTDGFNCDVMPTGCWWFGHFYDNELEFVERWRGTEKALKTLEEK